MFKKVGIVTGISAALLFGGAFSSSVSAQADSTNQEQANSYQVYYSVNSNAGTFSKEDIQSVIDKCFGNWKQQQTPAKQEQDQPEKAEENKQQEQTNEQPADKKEEAPSKEQAEQAPAPQENNNQTTAEESKQEQPEKAGQELNEFEQQVVELTNQERAKQGLDPLEIDTELSKVAREKSADMAENGYFDHNSPTYGSPFDMMKQFGISYKTAGENIAKGQRTPEEVVNAWMNSDGHRKNILNGNFTHIGVGYVENGNVWTQQFIGK
ncbi:CAP domain-containing protein [Virgibacillus senegalensis]|uniref:CAP domain-containing protein n=1 Tax=Virgibacillus senegalensis TaxID=1499679 RepID=UPI00069D29D6|nr:CAP domain-containing protein [Virgibacillus senegalensis]